MYYACNNKLFSLKMCSSRDSATPPQISIPPIVLLVPISIADSSMDMVKKFCKKFGVWWRCERKSEESTDYYLREKITHVVYDPDSEGNLR